VTTSSAVFVRRAIQADVADIVRLALEVQDVHVAGHPELLLLDQMGVDARHRSRGIGEALWSAVRETAAAEGVDRVVLNVWSFNREARRFYEQLGFTPFQERMAFEIQPPDHRSG
jgi:ribosomal protein S18 acetylase RimI-like enzyme